MTAPTRILLVEDDPDDAVLAERALEREGLRFELRRARTRQAFLRELEAFAPDLVLSDFRLPALDGAEVLWLLRERSSDIPCIFVSGALDEEAAVEVMRRGGTDVVLKDRLFKLGPSVRRALLEAQQYRAAQRLLYQQLAAIRGSLDGMAVLDDSGVLTYLNDAFARLHGRGAAAELTGTAWSSLLPPAERQRLERNILPYFRSSGRWRGETAGLRKDGAVFPLEVSLARIEGGGFVCVARDVTERKQAQAEHERLLELEKTARLEAESAGRAKDEFLALVSHELKTPLMSLYGWLCLLRAGRMTPEEAARALEVMERRLALLTRLIGDLVDVSAAVSGKLTLETRPIDPAQVLLTALELERAALRDKSISVDIVDPEDPLTVQGDPQRLEQVFRNLVANAVKFSRPGGKVRARLGREGAQVFIRIEDEGEGIAPEFLPHVFEPFTQGEHSLTRRHGGLGLGLTLAHSIVKLHGGVVEASSPGPGRGSTFTVKLPLRTPPPAEGRVAPAEGRVAPAEAPRPAAPKSAAQRPSPVLAGLRVLIVEDDLATLDLLWTVLEERGARVLAAASAAEGFELLRRESPDILVGDLVMPEEDGLSLIRRVRALGPGRGQVPALALTAMARPEDRRSALEAGYQAYLAKPFEPDALVRALASLIVPSPR